MTNNDINNNITNTSTTTTITITITITITTTIITSKNNTRMSIDWQLTNKKLNECEVITFGNWILRNLGIEALRRGPRVGGYFLNCRYDVVQHHCCMWKGNSPESMSLDDCLEKRQLFVDCIPRPSFHPIFPVIPCSVSFVHFVSVICHKWLD